MTAVAEFKTFDLDVVCEMTGAPSPEWLRLRLNSGEVPGVLAGKVWRMTRADMVALVDYMRDQGRQMIAKRRGDAGQPETPTRTPATAAGLSQRSAARMRRRSAL